MTVTASKPYEAGKTYKMFVLYADPKGNEECRMGDCEIVRL